MRAEVAVLGLAAFQRPWQCFTAPDKCGGHGGSQEGAWCGYTWCLNSVQKTENF